MESRIHIKYELFWKWFIWAKCSLLTGITSLGQNGLDNSDKEEALDSLQISWTGATQSDAI